MIETFLHGLCTEVSHKNLDGLIRIGVPGVPKRRHVISVDGRRRTGRHLGFSDVHWDRVRLRRNGFIHIQARSGVVQDIVGWLGKVKVPVIAFLLADLVCRPII